MKTQHRVLLVALLLAFGSEARRLHAEPAISSEAQGYFRNGVELLQSENPSYQDAYYQFKLAYEKSSSWKVLGNLGLCALKLERDGEALAYYEDYLKLGGRNVDRSEREAIERDLLLVRGNAASVEFTSDVEGEVIDTRAGSGVGGQRYPLASGSTTLLVRAGTHTFSARDKAGRSVKWDVTIAPGEKLQHEFDFDAPAKEAEKAEQAQRGEPEQRDVEPAASPSGGSPLRTVGFITVGAGVVAAGVGGVLALMAKGHESTALERCDAQMVCQSNARPEFDTAVSQMRTANILLVSGAALAAVGVGLVVFGVGSSEANASANAAAIQLTPLLGTSSGGVLASGRF
ncbi:MAG: hypothetical protein ACOY0T_30785 [Myxococcota bacterium]